MPRRNRHYLTLIALLTLLTAWFVTEAELYAVNTLAHHPHWTLPERADHSLVQDYCRTTRNLLAGNQLNLAVWHGYQEVSTREPVLADELSFGCRLASDAYVYAFVQGGRGIRLSRSEALPSAVVEVEPGGRFVRSRPLELEPDEGWHRYRLFRSEGIWRLKVDGGAERELARWPAEPGPIGFQGGYREACVDDVEIPGVLHESFRNRRHFGLLFAGSAGLTALMAGLVWRSRRGPGTVMVMGVLAILSLAWLTFDELFWSRRYLYNLDQAFAPAVGVEGFRASLVEALDPDGPAESPQPGRYPVKTYGNGPRTVVFLGTSQTWGLGARREEDRLVARVHRLVPELRLVNLALPGEDAARQVNRFFRSGLKPDLVAVNLGNNDNDRRAFGLHLAQLVDYADASGIPTIFFLEANAPESMEDDDLLRNHQVLQALARPCYDLHRELAGKQERGILWTDFVHLTSYGQALAAEFVARALRENWVPAQSRETVVMRLGPVEECFHVVSGVYPGEGGFAWSQGATSTFRFYWNGPARARLTVQARAHEAPLTATVRLNGAVAGTLVWPGTHELDVSPQPGENRLTLDYDKIRRLAPNDPRESSLCLQYLTLAPLDPSPARTSGDGNRPRPGHSPPPPPPPHK